MQLTRIRQYQILAIFGSGQPRSWVNTIWLGVGSMQIPQWEFEKLLNRCMEYGLIKRIDSVDSAKLRQFNEYVISAPSYDFQITEKGDQCLRNEQISRGGDSFYYKGFDRTASDKYADNIRMPKKEQ
jgi:hypothetical protein